MGRKEKNRVHIGNVKRAAVAKLTKDYGDVCSVGAFHVIDEETQIDPHIHDASLDHITSPAEADNFNVVGVYRDLV